MSSLTNDLVMKGCYAPELNFQCLFSEDQQEFKDVVCIRSIESHSLSQVIFKK
jgi:hypothetical protein